jgi:hypothetical protein
MHIDGGTNSQKSILIHNVSESANYCCLTWMQVQPFCCISYWWHRHVCLLCKIDQQFSWKCFQFIPNLIQFFVRQHVFCRFSYFLEWNALLVIFPHNCSLFYSLLQAQQEIFIRIYNTSCWKCLHGHITYKIKWYSNTIQITVTHGVLTTPLISTVGMSWWVVLVYNISHANGSD